jgi:hypothetical protein
MNIADCLTKNNGEACTSLKSKGNHLLCENSRCNFYKELNEPTKPKNVPSKPEKNYTPVYYLGLAIGLIIRFVVDIFIGLIHGLLKK